MTDKINPVILSGGVGSRLWPLSRALYPKQLLPLATERTMLQETALRVAEAARFAAPLVVANEEHRFMIAEQLRVVGIDPSAIILEPEGRNTAPAVALAALRLAADDPDALMLVMPSDHVIGDVAAFHGAVEAGARAAAADRLVTFGITPERPETGYGYIEAGDALTDGVRAVRRFVEKPDAATAAEYLASGRFYWNAGIFLFRAGHYLDELERQAPDILAACRAAMEKAASDLCFIRPDAAAFRASPSNSIDYAVMEKTASAAVVPVSMGWSDVGSWTALWEISPRDGDGNSRWGDVIALDSRNSLLRSEGPAIAALGLDDMVVVATRDA
ncbi:MAG TPA: mannose-1-phosphate guanylyltransferase/mannose-6-phosphate isomerase, partial [Sphingomonadales bacterium]